MGWARTAYGSAPYGGPTPFTTPPGWQPVPPPVPNSTTSFTYQIRPTPGPWGFRTWGGMLATPNYPGGGLAVAPDGNAGVMRIWAWWPDTTAIQLVRINQAGVRTPVRGAYTLTVNGSTRRNYSTNPSFGTDLSGYLPYDVNTTLSLSTVAGYVALGSTAMRMVSTTTTTGATFPGSLTGSGSWTIGVNLGFTAAVTSVTLTVSWLDGGGSSAGTNVLTFNGDDLVAAVGQTYRRKWNFAAPPTAVTGSVSMVIAGLPAGQYAYLDAVTLEKAVTDEAAFDGSVLGGQWAGTENLSTSIYAPVQLVVDGECPLDVPVAYEVFNPFVAGGSMTSPYVTLPGQNTVWLTHPSDPTSPLEALITTTPNVDYVLDQAIFSILDSRYPVAVSSSQRLAPAGEMELLVESFADRDQLVRSVFADGTPVLRRCPAEMGYGEGEWIVLSTIRETAAGQSPYDPLRTLTASYQVVQAPDAVT